MSVVAMKTASAAKPDVQPVPSIAALKKRYPGVNRPDLFWEKLQGEIAERERSGSAGRKRAVAADLPRDVRPHKGAKGGRGGAPRVGAAKKGASAAMLRRSA